MLDTKHCWIFPKHGEYKLDPHKMDCWTPPKLSNLDKLIPNFDHCESLYTKIDYKLEACVHEQLLKLQYEFRVHNLLVNGEMERQNIFADRLWVLSQRFLVLTQGGAGIKLYPEIVSEPTEKRILCEFFGNLRKLKQSNYCMFDSLRSIRATLAEFHIRCGKLDQTVNSVLMLGNESNMPLSYTKELYADLYNYFHSLICKLRCWEQLIDPGDARAIEDYKELIKPLKDYENDVVFVNQTCGCLRNKNPVC